MPVAFDLEKIRNDFPMLCAKVRGKPYVYLDNGATTLKPLRVIEAVRDFDTNQYATVKRGGYFFGDRTTTMFEEARETIAAFINASSAKEVIFTSGTTQSINLVAYAFGRKFIGKDDEIVITNIEHHANIVPWQVLCHEKGAVLKVIPVNDDGELVMEEYEKLLTDRTKLVAVTHVSNVLGTITPVKEIVAKAKRVGAAVLLDGAQAAAHMTVDVRDIGCDFYAFSSHKMYGPTGIGALYGRLDLLEEMPPYVTGGEMIVTVTLEKSTYAKPPEKFEAGTPPITQAIGFGRAVEYIRSIGMDNIARHEDELLRYGTEVLSAIPGLRIIGNARKKSGILSFWLDAAHPHDVLTVLDDDGIAVRAGHHCSQITMTRYCVPATTRASFGIYNRKEEIDVLAEALRKTVTFFS